MIMLSGLSVVWKRGPRKCVQPGAEPAVRQVIANVNGQGRAGHCTVNRHIGCLAGLLCLVNQQEIDPPEETGISGPQELGSRLKRHIEVGDLIMVTAKQPGELLAAPDHGAGQNARVSNTLLDPLDPVTAEALVFNPVHVRRGGAINAAQRSTTKQSDVRSSGWRNLADPTKLNSKPAAGSLGWTSTAEGANGRHLQGLQCSGQGRGSITHQV